MVKCVGPTRCLMRPCLLPWLGPPVAELRGHVLPVLWMTLYWHNCSVEVMLCLALTVLFTFLHVLRPVFFDCICRHVYSLQCFDSVCWASGRAFDLWKLSDEVWCGYLSAASCRLLAYGPANAHPRNASSLASSRLVLPFWYRPTQVVREEAVKQV